MLMFSLNAVAQECIIKRTADGRIARSTTQINHFKKANPCPSTGKPTGKCPGHVIDHVKPLCACGKDDASNMQWQTITDGKAKDKLEIKQCNELRKAGTV